MRMQESLVTMDDNEQQLRLSGLLSEWLFSSKFWSDINAKHGTMFDQFEEDSADVAIVNAIVDALEERIRALGKLDKCDVEFTYRWTAERKPLKASISRELLLSELTTFRDFLHEAAAKSCCVTFSL